jgi:hypothetical protein
MRLRRGGEVLVRHPSTMCCGGKLCDRKPRTAFILVRTFTPAMSWVLREVGNCSQQEGPCLHGYDQNFVVEWMTPRSDLENDLNTGPGSNDLRSPA